MLMTRRVEFRPYVPEGFEGEPVDEADALRRSRAVLAVEGRWLRGKWYQNLHPEVDPEDPFCNDWRVCAEGAVLMVTIGAARLPGRNQPWTPRLPDTTTLRRREAQHKLYRSSVSLLTRAGQARWPALHYSEANRFNDDNERACRTRTDVLGWFDDAIALAEGEA